MTGLHVYERDVTLPLLGGDGDLSPSEPEDALRLASRHLLRPDGPALVNCAWEHARWVPGLNCVATYRVEAADGRSLLLAVERRTQRRTRPVRAGLDPRLEQALPGLKPQAALDDGTLLWWFPADRALPGARRLLDSSRTRRWLQPLPEFAGLALRGRRTRVEILRYKPGQRAIARLVLGARDATGGRVEHTLAARALPPSRARDVLAARAACRGAAELAPRLVAADARAGLVLEEWVQAQPARSEDFSTTRSVGALMAGLHAEESTALTVRHDERALLDLFRVDRRLWLRAQHLLRPPATLAASLRWIHGDLHPDQIATRTDGAVVLLDWDALRAGDPAEDLASWWSDALAAEHTTPSVLLELLDGYAQAGGQVPSPQVLHAHAVHGLVRRGAAAIRRLQRGALERAGDLLDRAESLEVP